MKNKLLANYLRNRGNDLATVQISAFCVAMLSNNSSCDKGNNIFGKEWENSTKNDISKMTNISVKML